MLQNFANRMASKTEHQLQRSVYKFSISKMIHTNYIKRHTHTLSLAISWTDNIHFRLTHAHTACFSIQCSLSQIGIRRNGEKLMTEEWNLANEFPVFNTHFIDVLHWANERTLVRGSHCTQTIVNLMSSISQSAIRMTKMNLHYKLESQQFSNQSLTVRSREGK